MVLECVRGKAIRGQIERPEGAGPWFGGLLTQCGALELDVSVDREGEFITPPLPEGTSWQFRMEKILFPGRLFRLAKPGDRITIEVSPADDQSR